MNGQEWLILVGSIISVIVIAVAGFVENEQRKQDEERQRMPAATPRPRSTPRPQTPVPIHRILSGQAFQDFIRAAPKVVVHEDRDSAQRTRMLVCVAMRDEEDIHAVLVHDSTLGTGTYLRVPPDMKTCHEAVAWTFRMEPWRYRLEKET